MSKRKRKHGRRRNKGIRTAGRCLLLLLLLAGVIYLLYSMRDDPLFGVGKPGAEPRPPQDMPSGPVAAETEPADAEGDDEPEPEGPDGDAPPSDGAPAEQTGSEDGEERPPDGASTPRDTIPPELAAKYDGMIVDPAAVYGYDQMVTDIAELEAEYPELISSYVIGSSVEGRDIPAFNLGRGKREVIICASMHASEHITTNFVMYMTESYCRGYREDASLDGLSYRTVLDNVKFIIVPMINPDGVTLAQFGLSAVSDPEAVKAIGGDRDDYFDWKANIRGVDLNGNFEWKWGMRDDISEPAPYGYVGPYACSEPETRAMRELLDSSDYYLLSSMHIRGEVIYWLDTDTLQLYDRFYPTAKRFADAFDFTLLEPEDVSDRGGYMVNTERAMKQKYGMTVEMCSFWYSDPYPISRFETDAARVYSMGLIMGDEAMKMDPLPVVPDVIFDGKILPLYGMRPVMKNGCVMTEAFDMLRRCGADYEWLSGEGVLRAWKDGREVSLSLGGEYIYADGEELAADAPLCYEEDRLMMPALQVLTALGVDAQWDGESMDLTVRTERPDR
ncbi:MAG: hypothetical protein K5855_02275 [Oscillospiraceae bacterium]|nr:hypothetical protein [Oscillospiraceae bacterium]